MDLRLPLFAIGMALVLAAAVTAFVAAHPEAPRGARVGGAWRVDFGSDGAAGETPISFHCQLTLEDANAQVRGQANCGGPQPVSVTGFVSNERSQFFLSIGRDIARMELQGNITSRSQVVGSWQRGDGLSGRFIAIRKAAP